MTRAATKPDKSKVNANLALPPVIALKASQRIAAGAILGKMQYVVQRQQEFDRARQALENCATLRLEIEAEKKEFFAECEAEYNLPAGCFERGEYTIQDGEIVKQG